MEVVLLSRDSVDVVVPVQVSSAFARFQIVAVAGSTFDARWQGIGHCTSPIVAFTEDHVILDPNGADSGRGRWKIFGPGDTPERSAKYESNRIEQVCQSDLRALQKLAIDGWM